MPRPAPSRSSRICCLPPQVPLPTLTIGSPGANRPCGCLRAGLCPSPLRCSGCPDPRRSRRCGFSDPPLALAQPPGGWTEVCGIAGVSLRSGKPADEFLGRLSRLLAHRGPDGEGVHRHRGSALVHRRLSILDLEGGAQPIPSEDGLSHIIANGEIYNYRRLQGEIRGWGVKLRTDSDSEVPLHFWRRFGMKFTRHLEGMYALAIQDDESEELILARDPVGIKPLYIAETGQGLAFASEAGALVKSGWIEAEVETDAWPSYFNKQYVEGPLTLFRGVRRVEPGEVLRIRRGEIVERRCYPLELSSATRMGEEEALAAFDRLVSDAVGSHLQSDVPYGAFLSGGIDSTCVVTRMAELAGEVRTYSIGFSSDTVSDERGQALRLARALNTSHQAVEFSEADFWELLPEMCRVMDDLVADYAILPTLKLAALAGEQVKVILSGEGGDEGFAGYPYYSLHEQGFLSRLRHGEWFRSTGNAHGFGSLFRDARIPDWRDGPRQARFGTRGLTRLQRFQARDLSDWLPDDLMLKVDRCLMAHGIEGRVPLLDRRLLEFAFALPDDLKIRGDQHKYLLRRWVADHQPQQEPWAPKKGFTVPIRPWLESRRVEIRDYLGGHPGLEDLLVPDAVNSWLDTPLDPRGAKLLFNILCYAVWHDLHVERTSPPEALLRPSRNAAGMEGG
ncbi:MAG: asparagine synthase (glutamine-hydrolyzing) [Gemmatimonadales bacterium]|nr:MAG: asparagine synthase (glutamine-hydrolyzing) [Gemmatimonadales bacterium]